MRYLSPPDVAIFVEHMKQKCYAIGTINGALVLLRYEFELAMRWKEPGVEVNPVKEIKNIKRQQVRALLVQQTGRSADASSCAKQQPNA